MSIAFITAVNLGLDTHICFHLSRSAGLSNFITNANHSITQFESLLNQIQKNERDIEAKLQAIESANLFKFPVPERAGQVPGNELLMA